MNANYRYHHCTCGVSHECPLHHPFGPSPLYDHWNVPMHPQTTQSRGQWEMEQMEQRLTAQIQELKDLISKRGEQ